MTDKDFDCLTGTIRDRPLTTFRGFWFNLIEYREHQFIQGDLYNETSEKRCLRQVSALVEGIRAEDIEGFWPEIQGYPVEKSEEDLIVSYLSHQGKNDMELIVPERNRACPVAWGRFDESREFDIYRKFIYPAVIEAIEEIEEYRDLLKACL